MLQIAHIAKEGSAFQKPEKVSQKQLIHQAAIENIAEFKAKNNKKLLEKYSYRLKNIEKREKLLKANEYKV